ncbi:MAG: GNAT family N-acetyltransferase [Spirochaetota bacterium]
MEIRIADSFRTVPAAEWNKLVEAGNPFMRHEFFAALENTGCIGRTSAWQPLLFLGFNPQLVAAIPAFIRSDSYGEYIFDWAWANAYAQAGIAYYPKLAIAAPFTPATGRRLLGDTDPNVQTALMAAMVDECEKRGMSGIHVLCETRDEQRFLSHHAFSPRLTHQYHWLNRGFATFDDYLGSLRAHRRKEIRRERRKAAELGLRIRTLTGDAISEDDMLAMYSFYVETYARKWGSPYLNRETFLELYETMRSYLVLVLADDGGRPVAGSIAFRAADRLYGRYWGALAYYPFLHFELCIYRLIDYAIEEKIKLFEAGAQGEHKFARGFTAMPVLSSHRLFHTQGAAAIEDFLRRERRATARAIHAYRAASPNKDEPAYVPEPEER